MSWNCWKTDEMFTVRLQICFVWIFYKLADTFIINLFSLCWDKKTETRNYIDGICRIIVCREDLHIAYLFVLWLWNDWLVDCVTTRSEYGRDWEERQRQLFQQLAQNDRCLRSTCNYRDPSTYVDGWVSKHLTLPWEVACFVSCFKLF